jgi:hypothetical protein
MACLPWRPEALGVQGYTLRGIPESSDITKSSRAILADVIRGKLNLASESTLHSGTAFLTGLVSLSRSLRYQGYNLRH